MFTTCSKAVWAGALALGVLVAAASPRGADGAGEVRKVVSRVNPTYPPLAQTARLTGSVKLVAVVTPEGSVKSVRTLGGNALFVASAEQAVKQWKYAIAPKETVEAVVLHFEVGH